MLLPKIILCMSLFVVFGSMAIVPMFMDYKDDNNL